MKEILHFAHGNGFPARSYQQLLMHLQAKFECFYIERIGHDARFPVTENWEALVQELTVSIELIAAKPVVAVGHSMGGILSLLASIQRPDLFKKVIMIDAPLLGWTKSKFIYLAKKVGMIDYVTPAFRTKTRCIQWDNQHQIKDYLLSRDFFKTFSANCLEDYMTYGFQKTPSGYSLFFDRQIEYDIYRTLPDRLYQLKGPLTTPTWLIYGDQSTVTGRWDVYYMKKYYGISSIKLPGSHMLPMEDPQALAETIINGCI